MNNITNRDPVEDKSRHFLSIRLPVGQIAADVSQPVGLP
jgi:hypothetical protein